MSFYKILSKYYDEIFPSNPHQIHFIKSITRNHKRILDVAAGSGNQAIELAKEGYQVTATDLDSDMVDKIRQKSITNNVNIHALPLDMREVETLSEDHFDAVMCIGNSIVHLDSLAEIENTVKKFNNVLADEGKLLIQIVNYDRILNNQITELPLIERPKNGLTFIRTYDHVDGKIKFNGKLIINHPPDVNTYNNTVELYPLTSKQLKSSLESAGFHNIKLYGSFKGEDYHTDSPALIAVGYK